MVMEIAMEMVAKMAAVAATMAVEIHLPVATVVAVSKLRNTHRMALGNPRWGWRSKCRSRKVGTSALACKQTTRRRLARTAPHS
jgi:hypothetical protein